MIGPEAIKAARNNKKYFGTITDVFSFNVSEVEDKGTPIVRQGAAY